MKSAAVFFALLMMTFELRENIAIFPEPQFIRGDANADGIVDLPDAQYILAWLFDGAPDPTCQDALDANDDGSIFLNDAVYLLCFLFQGGPPPHEPFPVCGIDQTDDDLEPCEHDPCA